MYSLRQQFRTLVCGLVSGLIFLAVPSAAEPGDWLIRVGGSQVDPDASSGVVTGIPGSGVDADDATQLSFNLTYMMTNKWALELLASLPFTHDVNGTGSIAALGEIAEVKHLPPTLSLQYHFAPKARVRPYIGAGLNLTLFFEEKASDSLVAALGPTEVSLDESVGLAAQVGVDIGIKGPWFLNIDLRKIDLNTNATLNSGGVIREVDVTLDPLVLTFSIGRGF